MKKNTLLSGAMLLTTVLLSALCAPAQSTSIKWLETRHDFGAFDESVGQVTCRFRYVNTGNEPLVVIRATASCGCTRPDYDRSPLAPGDTATLTVAFDPAGRPGRFNKKISVETNTTPASSRLSITGVVIGDAGTVAARYPNDMGRLKLSTQAALLGVARKTHVKSIFIDGYNRSGDTIVPTATTQARWLEVTPAPRRVAPGERVSFNFFISPDHSDLYGLVVDTVHFATGDGHSYALPAIVTFEEDFSRLTAKDYAKAPVCVLSTTNITPGDMAGNAAKVTITNGGKTTLNIRRAYTMMPGVNVQTDRSTVKPGKTAVITITIDPDTLKSDHVPVSIITDDPVTPVQSISLTGMTSQTRR